jgi:hypothetical protein
LEDLSDGGATTIHTHAVPAQIAPLAVQTVNLGNGATTIALTSNTIILNGHGESNTISTITGGLAGEVLTIICADALVTITDTASGANTVNLSAAFTSADNKTLTLVFDGTSWFEIARSIN